MNMQPFVDAALTACKEVAHFLQTSQSQTLFQTYTVGAGGDLSFGFDIEAEEIFVRHLGDYGTIHSEEAGVIGDEHSEYTIILDPVDGSDNFKSRIPYYGTSIALQHESNTLVGIICNFCTGECFVRAGDERFCVNLSKIDKKEPLDTGSVPKAGLFEKAYEHPEIVAKLQEQRLKFRAPGAVALSLGYAYYVNYVLFLGTMRPYDLAAGMFWCEGLHCYQDDNLLIIAKDEHIFQQLLQLFKRSSSEHS